jgi:hypothetical protein
MLEKVKLHIKFADTYIAFILIIIGIILFIISFYVAYLFLAGAYGATMESDSFIESMPRFGFLGLMILVAYLIVEGGIKFYRTMKHNDRHY